MLTDSFGRRIDYLRLSVTDRCNLRCAYCLPESYSRFAPAGQLLSADEITFLAERFAEMGMRRIRITGGEPLVRDGIVDLIGRVSAVPGLADVSLSTNGLLLKELARPLARAGLKRVNVSLDSLNPKTFRDITRFGDVADALAGIEAALSAGLHPVKLNVVIARGLNDGEIAEFARMTQDADLHVRFIELMPMGETGFFSRERWVPLDEIAAKAGPLEPLRQDEWPAGRGPARYHKRPGAKGTVGFISALSCGFCSSCNRMRLTAQGTLMPCLDGGDGLDLRRLLRAGAGAVEIRQAIADAVRRKPERHSMLERVEDLSSGRQFMCQIGG